MITNLVAYLFIVSAGIGFIAAFCLSALADILAARGYSRIQLDVIASPFSYAQAQRELVRDGVHFFYVLCWFIAFGFLLLWMSIGQLLPGVWLSAFLYVLLVYVLLAGVGLHRHKLGFFGAKHEARTPRILALFALVYWIILALLVPAIA